MRVAFLIPTLDASGAEKQLALLAEHLPRDEFDPQVLTLDRTGPYGDRLAEAGIPVHPLGKRLKLDPWAFARLVRTLRRLKPDILETWLFAGHLYGQTAARLVGVPTTITNYRCVDVWKKPWQLAMDRWISRGCQAIITNTHAVQDFYVAKGFPADRFHVLANAAVPPPDTGRSREEVRKELGIAPGTRVVGFIGRLSRQKRVKDLIWALDILRIGQWDAEVVLVGDGPDRVLLQRFARNIEICDAVHFLGRQQAVGDYLRAMDVLVLPSAFEGMPNVVLEAMCVGVPVVATRIPGMEEVVQDDVSGLLVPVGKPLEIARAVSRILDQPDLAQRLAEAARIRVEQSFSLDRMVRGHASLLRSLAGRS